jgi:uncharacterized membrane protein YidH (DUF202 family)
VTDADAGADAVWSGGTQNERTTMAWTRTALAVAGCGVLVARQTGTGWAALAVLVVTATATGLLISSAERRYHARGQALLSGDPVVAVRHVLLAAAVSAALGATALLTIML